MLPFTQSRSPYSQRRRMLPALTAVWLPMALLVVVGSCIGTLAHDADETTPGPDPTEAAAPPVNPFPNAVEVPVGILEGGTEWLNTSHPIELEDLRGKIVILDFWTYCCINCMHVLPDLKFLEEKYPNQLVVIGVHSAKFDNEKDSKAIRDAIMRYEIQHPVVNDSEMLIWRRFGTSAWPTLALIDPEGRYAGSQSGEGHRELFDNVISKLIDYHRAKGTLDETPIVFRKETAAATKTPLRYPGKITADPDGQRLIVSDSNHNRIVVATMAGELKSVIGTGEPGAADGSFDQAQFNRPQGTVLDGQTLYVADTENHLVRAIDLSTGTVSTLAGTGAQGSYSSPDRGLLRETPLNSPWSLAIVNRTLFIAMAGSHQIWSHELGSDSIGVFAGSGREDVINGELAESAFAQPSEIVADAAGEFLYVADSEGSAIRRVPTDPAGLVTTVAGTSELPRGQSLFAFGNTDGVGPDARFQHPLSIAILPGGLLVADSYNHSLRDIALPSAAVSTWVGTGVAGAELQPLQLSEPGGLAVAGDVVFVADTNNHRIVAINRQSRMAAELAINGLSAPVLSRRTTVLPGEAIPAEAVRAAATDKLTIRVTLNVPNGYKLNELAPVTWEATAGPDQTVVPADALSARSEVASVVDGVAVIELPLTGQPGETRLTLFVSYGYCGSDQNALCRLATARWQIPLVVNTDGGVSECAVTFPQPAASNAPRIDSLRPAP